MSDNINATDARRIYEDCRIASDNIDAILNETTSAYVSRRYIREKLENVEYAVKFIRSVVEETDYCSYGRCADGERKTDEQQT